LTLEKIDPTARIERWGFALLFFMQTILLPKGFGLSALVAVLLIVVIPRSSLGAEVDNFLFSQWQGPPITVYSVEPRSVDEDAPVVFVMHGVLRNAADYRDNWIGLAREYGLNIYAPEFDAERFPGAASYNLGGVGSDAASAFDAIEPLFARLRAQRGLTATGYVVFGHSAGAQFVHRFACFAVPEHLQLAIVANAGWYTLPEPEEAWPYGLGAVDAGQCEVGRWLGQPLLILLGDQDTDPEHRYLRRTPEAMRQGPHRFARGQYFLEAGRAAAAARGVPFRWRLQTVPGVGHDNAGMARAVASRIRQWVEEWQPAAAGSR